VVVFRRRTPPEKQPSGDAYDGLRTMALGITEAEVGKPPPEHAQVLGAVIDVPSAGGIASVVAMADGTTSMYTSTSGGIIGAGAHEAVVAKSHALLAALQGRIEMFPVDDRVDQITLITPTGRRRASVPAAAFWGREPSTVVDLIASIQDVISAISETGPPT
jgi:hypothetical protein